MSQDQYEEESSGFDVDDAPAIKTHAGDVAVIVPHGDCDVCLMVMQWSPQRQRTRHALARLDIDGARALGQALIAAADAGSP
jgi:hypothetical protein